MKLISDYNYIGPSMQPLFRPGDGIIVDADVKFSALMVGDIICYPKPDYLLLLLSIVLSASITVVKQ